MARKAQIPTDFFAPALVNVESRADGTIVLSSGQTLGDYPRCLGEHLVKWARQAPDRVFLAQRAGDGEWQRLTYGDTLVWVTGLAAGLLARGLGPERPLAILSGNSIAHGLLTLAAMHVGVPVAPLSPSYALLSKDYIKLNHVLGLTRPGLIYVENAKPFEPALAAINLEDIDLVSKDGASGTFECDSLDDLFDASPEAAIRVQRAFDAVTSATVAKILFTSGSTGDPKGVKNTQRMLCSNQQALAQLWPFLERRPPVLVDWLPWNHTFGANHNFNLILRNGGSLYIDDGKPTPAAIGISVENLKDISPTLYFNVPSGFEALLPHLETDRALARSFFEDLDLLFYAAAALPQNLWDRLEAIATKTMGRKPVFSSGWGSTETAPLATSVHYVIDKAATLGLPIPGVEIKMVPCGDAYELRVKGANITPGYWRQPELDRAAFDAEGYYLIGDAGKFTVPGNPAAGIVFDGRLGENFKLRSGTWVNVGALRIAAIGAAKPVIRDAVVAGEGYEYLSLLIFPNEDGCREVAGDKAAELTPAELIAHPKVRRWLKEKLSAYNEKFPASSTRLRRALIMLEPPEIDAGETTDKGYINQRGVLASRAQLVERLYGDHPDVIEISHDQT